MKLKIKIAVFISMCVVTTSCQKKEKGPLVMLDQIEGSWWMPAGENGSEGVVMEEWKKVNDTLYSGKSFDIINGDSTIYETIQLVASGKDIFYIPTMQDQNDRQPVSFKLTKQEKNKFTFENPKHDFPTTIIYDFQSDSLLNASISGTINGEIKGMEFLYRRK